METFSALLAICAGNSPVLGEFPSQRPVTRSFDVFFELRMNKRLSKQSWGWWFETLSSSLWRHSNGSATETTIWRHDRETFSILLILCEPPMTYGTFIRSFYILLCYPEQSVEKTLEWSVICHAMTLMWHHYDVLCVCIRYSRYKKGIVNWISLITKVWHKMLIWNIAQYLSAVFRHDALSFVEVWEWISNFVPHFIANIFTNPCSD